MPDWLLSLLLFAGHLLFGLVCWFVALVVAPAARSAFDARREANRAPGGVAIMPGWPTIPLALFIPLLLLGPGHPAATAIAAVNGFFLVWGGTYTLYFLYRARQAN